MFGFCAYSELCFRSDVPQGHQHIVFGFNNRRSITSTQTMSVVSWQADVANRQWATTINALILVRPIKAPPHPDQSAMLTQFAESQNGKKFGLFRLAVYVLPVRPKMSASADQSSWYCSELSVAALRHAGMIADGSDTTSVLPHEIYHNRSVDLSERFWPSLAWSPERQFPQHRPVLSPLRPE